MERPLSFVIAFHSCQAQTQEGLPDSPPVCRQQSGAGIRAVFLGDPSSIEKLELDIRAVIVDNFQRYGYGTRHGLMFLQGHWPEPNDVLA